MTIHPDPTPEKVELAQDETANIETASGDPSLLRTDKQPERPAPADQTLAAPTESYHSPDVDRTLELSEPSTVSSSAKKQFPILSGYTCERELGRGGMGLVYLAKQTKLKRYVALKVVRGVRGDTAEQFERFRVEAEAVAALKHPNIVQIFEIGEVDGEPYCALEYIDGGSLSSYLKQNKLEPKEGAKILEGLARAIHHAHQKGILHRDLKPANVLMERDGTPKVTDFGLAKRMDMEDSGLTRSGAIVGTPAYMSPEQAAGDTKYAGPESDIYALGAILYEIMTGKPPFMGATVVETIEKVLKEDPVPPSLIDSSIPRDLETICLQCLAKSPTSRYRSALALAQDLERFQADEPILARRESLVRRAYRKARKRAPGIGSLVLLVVAITTLLWAWFELSANRRLTEITKQFQEGLSVEEFDGSAANDLEKLVERISVLDPQRGEQARAQLKERVAEQITSILGRARLNREDIATAEGKLRWLEERDNDSATRLRDSLRARTRDWQARFELKPPFENLTDLFLPSEARIDSNQVILERANSTESQIELIRTNVLSNGRIRTDFEFDSNWRTCSRLGVVIHHRPGLDIPGKPGEKYPGVSGYSFSLTPAWAPVEELSATAVRPRGKSPPKDFTEADGYAELCISRNGMVLQSKSLTVPSGSLRFTAIVDGTSLQLRLNESMEIGFSDSMLLDAAEPSYLAILLGGRVGLKSVRVAESLLPKVPSPLEEADELFGRGEYALALSKYTQQTRIGGGAKTESHVKEGLCFAALNQSKEAVTAFEQAMSEGGEPWELIAAIQLWALKLKQKDYAEAENLFGAISVKYPKDQLINNIPYGVREELLASNTVPDLNLLRSASEVIPQLEARHRLVQQLGITDGSNTIGKLRVALALAGKHARTIELAEKESLEIATSTSWDLYTCEELYWNIRFATWSHRVLNEPDVGQRFIDRLRVLYSIPQGADRSLAMEISRRFAPLLIDQARNQIAMGDIQLAEQLIDQFFAEMPDTYIHYNIYSQPYLLKGFLRAERGDMAEAESYWRRGLWESYQATVPPYLRLNRPSPFGIFGAIDHWIMASLLGELSDQEADGIIKELFSRGGSEALLSQVTSTVEISPALMRDAWRSPRGRKLAKQMAYLNIEPMDYIQTPPTLLLYQKFRQDFFGGSPTEDQDQVTWDAVKSLVSMYFNRELSNPQVLQLALAAKGITGNLGWSGFIGSIPKERREPITYLMGLRYLGMKKTAEGKTLLKSIVESEGASEVIKKLAEAGLEAIGP